MTVPCLLVTPHERRNLSHICSVHRAFVFVCMCCLHPNAQNSNPAKLVSYTIIIDSLKIAVSVITSIYDADRVKRLKLFSYVRSHNIRACIYYSFMNS